MGEEVTGVGVCPVGCRLTLPLWYPAGGVPALSPANPAFSLLCCPHPPARARRALFPSGEGGDFFVFLCKGLRPLHPQG